MTLLRRIEKLEAQLENPETDTMQFFWKHFRHQYNQISKTPEGAEVEALVVAAVEVEYREGYQGRKHADALRRRAWGLQIEAAQRLGYSDLAAWMQSA